MADVCVDVTGSEGKLSESGAIEPQRASFTKKRQHLVKNSASGCQGENDQDLFDRARRHTWEVPSDELLHPGDNSLPELEVFLGDAVLPGGSLDGDVQGPQVRSRGRRQRPQLVLLLLLLMQKSL